MSSDNKKLYVGSLPYSVSEDELRELFGQYGSVSSVRIITDKFTGQSKGFGFVEMESSEDAEKAIQGVNGQQVGGRTLTVNIARPPAEREERRFNNGGGRERRFNGPRRGF